jgi:2'-5' RNA ligase
MSNLVIVAIPEEMDRVWKLSSEKVPHLTLLFLGEMETNPHVESIVQFVEHAVTLSEHGPFYLDVDHRGTLGPDEADVLFFSKRSWNLKWIKQFRGQLLQNEQIRSAYDSVANQYETWEPHLTMGYPTAPAKEMGENDHPLYSVCFDRIAVWTTDFDGPEFRLEWPDRELAGELAVAYADTQKAALMHKTKNGVVDEKSSTPEQVVKLGEEFVAHQNQSVLDNPTLAEQIKAKIQSILDDVTGDADKDVALFGDPLIRTKLKSVLDDFYKDPNIDNAVVYDALGAAFIEHYGKKGMRWGFRKDTPSAVAPAASSKVRQGNRRKTKIKTTGGQNHPAHPDAIKVAEAKAKLKKSGTAALSNHELRDVASRVQLENQVKLLTSHRGKQFVTQQLKTEGANVARTGIREGAKRGAKKAGIAALA